MKTTRNKPRHAGRHIILQIILTCFLAISCTSPDAIGPPNEPPVVKVLAADPVVLSAGETSEITVVATDPDGDKLTFEWTADLGYLTGQGARVFYAAPLCCASWATVRVTVNDGNGGVARETVTLTIQRGQ